MPYRVPFRVASAFLAGVVLHTLLHFDVHSGQLRSDCRHPGSGRYAAGPSLFPQPKTTRRGETAASDRCLASRTLKSSLSSRGSTKTPGSGRRTTVVMGRQAIRAIESLFEDGPAGAAPSRPFNYPQGRRYQNSKVANSGINPRGSTARPCSSVVM